MSTLIGQGWSFPIKPNASGKLALSSGDEKIRQSIWLILSTAPGERVMQPKFGCGMHDLVFEANTSTLRGIIRDKVKIGLVDWEPRIDVIDVKVETNQDAKNHLLIHIDYRVRSNNAFYNLVYPFFINEGPS